MSKIFEFIPGSYIDKVSGAIGVNTNGEMVRSEKGMAYRCDGASRVIYPGLSLSGDFSIYTWYNSRYKGSSDMQPICESGSSFQPFRIRSGLWNYYITDGLNPSSQGLSSPYLNDGKWHFLMLICDNDGDISLYADGVLLFNEVNSSAGTVTLVATHIGQGASSDWMIGDIGRTVIYDHILTQKERAKLYSDFLNASPIERDIY